MYFSAKYRFSNSITFNNIRNQGEDNHFPFRPENYENCLYLEGGFFNTTLFTNVGLWLRENENPDEFLNRLTLETEPIEGDKLPPDLFDKGDSFIAFLDKNG